MTAVKKRTFSVTAEQSDYVDRKVMSGAYASSSEVVREGLRLLERRDAEFSRWLREEVLPSYEEYKRDPSTALPLDAAFDEVLGEAPSETRRRRGRSAAKSS
jgi:antitoxin ParD1/3/4